MDQSTAAQKWSFISPLNMFCLCEEFFDSQLFVWKYFYWRLPLPHKSLEPANKNSRQGQKSGVRFSNSLRLLLLKLMSQLAIFSVWFHFSQSVNYFAIMNFVTTPLPQCVQWIMCWCTRNYFSKGHSTHSTRESQFTMVMMSSGLSQLGLQMF